MAIIILSNTVLAASLELQIERVISNYAYKNFFQGNVLVFKKGKILFQKSYGSANSEHYVPNKYDTPIERKNQAALPKLV